MNLSDTGPLVQARELLLDALASLDAGYEWPSLSQRYVFIHPVAFAFSGQAIRDAAGQLGCDPIDADEIEEICEHAIELLDHQLDTGRRPTASPL